MHWYIAPIVGLITGLASGVWAYKKGYRTAQEYAAEEIRYLMSKLHWENREPPHCPGCDCGMIERILDQGSR